MPLQTWEEFLPLLIQARHDQGLLQATVAKRIGVVQSALSLWENRSRTPTQENAERWAEFLGVKMPMHATLWFSHMQKAKPGKPAHGTRNGYHWHRTTGNMPACDPCLKAAAEYTADRRRQGLGS